MSSKTKVIFIIVLSIIFIEGIGFYIWRSGGFDLSSIIMVLVSVLLAVFIFRKVRALRSGTVLEDELTDKLRNQAGARSFYMSMYLWIALSYIYDFESETTMFGIGGMAILFAVNYFVLANGKK